MNETPTILVDCRGMACPGPITEVARAYRKAQNGDVLEILATDPAFVSDIKAWVRATTNKLLSLEENDGIIRALVKITAKQ
ncbi:MAG: sulfurtransferase TusA family protein [Candidatus Hermodarchaeota archaeon]